MKKFTLLVTSIFLLSFYPSLGQNDITIGKIETIESKILGESRPLMIHVPNADSNTVFEKKKYPVLYVLDGYSNFTSIVGLLERFSGNSITPEMIVVGIPNTNRTRDLTPTKSKPNPPMAPEGLVEQSGGGKKFLAFIEEELQPYINSKYPTEPYNVLIGHSLGGLFVMDALLDKPELFNGYISIDPSMWWDDKILLNSFKSADFNDVKFKHRSLYLGIANSLPKGLDTIAARSQKGPMAQHFNSIFESRDILRTKRNSQFDFGSKFYENDTHNSVALISAYDGLRFIFDFYRFDIAYEEIMDENTTIVNDIKVHYSEASEKLGYENKPDESMLNRMGYQLMSMNKMELAGEFFKLNVNYYPNSFNVYDSLGDYYLETQNKDMAIQSFEKALSIREFPASREKLEQLKGN